MEESRCLGSLPTPPPLQGIFLFHAASYRPLTYGGRHTYVYPWWAEAVGWGLTLSSVLCLPSAALAQLLLQPGPLPQVSPAGPGGWLEGLVLWAGSEDQG